MRRFLLAIPVSLFLIFLITFAYIKQFKSISKPPIKIEDAIPTPPPAGGPTPAPPTPTPTPRPLTFAEMNALYGPCVKLPTLMYHHIQPLEEAEAAKHKYLAVAPEIFRSQLQYLRDKGYRTATMAQLASFFNSGVAVPPKSVLLTFDDGYADFATHAVPILNEFGFSATLFLSTGLAENADYVTWSQVQSFPSSILVANHTWSHKSMQTSLATVEKEITTADTQLAQRNLNSPKTFAYPYGFSSQNAQNILAQLGYQVAFTTNPGSILCSKRRLELPRLRIGNGNLSAYGL